MAVSIGYTGGVRFLCSDLADRLGGSLVGPDRPVHGATIDSRAVEPDQLFVPLVAARDGHDFVADALHAGAGATMSSRHELALGGEPTVIRVDDTALALAELGRIARRRLTGPVVGITGSVGKTSMKDLTLAACSGPDRTGGPVWASAQSFNNELGVPLTLANAPDDTAIAVVEMGSRGVGHITELCGIARPTVGVVTAVALVHSELFGSIEAVARGKGELVEALPTDGTAVLNGDDPLVAAMAGRTEADAITFGTGASVDVAATDVRLDELLRPTLRIESPWGKAELTLETRGAHMASNAAGALAASVAAGVAFDDAVAGLTDARLSRWRMEVTKTRGGVVVVNDAYNANPTSVRAALASLRALAAEPQVAVLGLMAELGEEGPAEHRAVADEAAGAGVRVVAVGCAHYGPAAEHVQDVDEADALLADLPPGAAVLVKGSRVAGLERLAQRLIAG